MNPQARLRFKIVTSFAVALMGCIAWARLWQATPLSYSSLTAFLIIGLLIVAGAWRGIIYMRLVRAAPKP